MDQPAGRSSLTNLGESWLIDVCGGLSWLTDVGGGCLGLQMWRPQSRINFPISGGLQKDSISWQELTSKLDFSCVQKTNRKGLDSHGLLRRHLFPPSSDLRTS